MTKKEAIKIFNEVLLFGKAHCTQAEFKELAKMSIQALEQETRSEWEQDHEILKAYSDGANEVLDKIRAEIAKYGSITVSYAITKDTKTDKGIEKLVSDVLKEAKEQVLEIIDKHKGESGDNK